MALATKQRPYGVDLANVFRRTAAYADRILHLGSDRLCSCFVLTNATGASPLMLAKRT
jgi:hypothetical protein